MTSSLRSFTPLLTLAALALLSGCSTNLFGGRHAAVDQGPVVEGHPLILPPDYDLHPPRNAANYEDSLPKEHFGARKIAEGQRTVRDAATITSTSMIAVSETTLSVAPALPANPSLAATQPPLSATPAHLNSNIAGAISESTVASSDDMQAAIARDTAQENADNNGFFHKYFGWMIPGHGKK